MSIPGLPYEQLLFRLRLDKLVIDLYSLKHISGMIVSENIAEVAHDDWSALNQRLDLNWKMLKEYANRYPEAIELSGLIDYALQISDFIEHSKAPKKYDSLELGQIDNFIQLAQHFKML